MGADRTIDPARGRGLRFCLKSRIERLAHTVKALKLEAPPNAGKRHDGRDGTSVVSRELRVEHVSRSEQTTRAGDVRHIGRGLAREDRIAIEPSFLRPLDLCVPISTLDEAYLNTPAGLSRESREPIDHRRRALLVGLYSEAETLPAIECGVGKDPGKHVERDRKTVRFFGIDCECDTVVFGLERKGPEPRHQFGHHPVVLRKFVARMDSGELYRDAVLRSRRATAQGRNRRLVGRKVALGIIRRVRGLPEHVERRGRARLLGAAKGFLDRVADDELAAEDAHRV